MEKTGFFDVVFCKWFCREVAEIGKATCAATQKRGSEERRGHRLEVHRQQVRLIRQQESDDRRSQSLGLAKWSAEQCIATRFPQGPLHGIPCMHKLKLKVNNHVCTD